MPNSPSVDFFDQQIQVVAQGGFVEWNGTARNSANGKSQTYELGVLRLGQRASSSRRKRSRTRPTFSISRTSFSRTGICGALAE